jgi:hypothetical protein
MGSVLQVDATRKTQQPCHIFSKKEIAVKRKELNRGRGKEH